jgi:hypothetical protein
MLLKHQMKGIGAQLIIAIKKAELDGPNLSAARLKSTVLVQPILILVCFSGHMIWKMTIGWMDLKQHFWRIKLIVYI